MRLGTACLLTVALALGACGDDASSSGGGDPGCALWRDLLLEQDDQGVSDARAEEVAREIAEVTDDDQVRAFATALAARLRDGVDISKSFDGLSAECGLG